MLYSIDNIIFVYTVLIMVYTIEMMYTIDNIICVYTILIMLYTIENAVYYC